MINAVESIRRVLVVCPASLKLNWQRELSKWLTRPMSIDIANGYWPTAQVVIVNYDILKKWHRSIRLVEWDLLVVDEVHLTKNYKAERTKQVWGKWDRDPEMVITPIPAKRILALTGTPICNRPIELWTIVHALDQQNWRSWKYYVDRYCGCTNTRYGMDVTGATNMDELQRRLRETVMIRRMKADVLKELPPKRRQVMVLPAGSVDLSGEAQARAAVEARLEELRAAVELAKAQDSEEEYRKAVDALNRGAFASFEEISRIRHDTAVAKAPLVIEHLRETLESEQKVVVFAWHHDVIDAICEGLREFNPVHVTGEDALADRQAAVDAFQQDPATRVFVGSITAAGVGLTLTAASTVVFAELDWVPGNISQAEDRLHRIGQRDTVLVQHVVLEGSIDEKLATTIIDKQAVIEQALNGGGQSLEDATKPVVISLPAADQPASQKCGRADIAEEAKIITTEQIAAVHQALRYLCANDPDYSLTLNGVGFNHIDARIGHELGDRPFLSPKQAVLGRKVVRKYRRQLVQFDADIMERMGVANA